ncbi:MAG TPA: hypothetical protein VE487_16265 [Ilumatobacter sp.]|nr:hypothetical protein [Ilumatobacter sp.]
MTDYWSRPGSSGRPDFEITLFGAEGSAGSPASGRGDDGDDGDEPSGRRWGAIVGLTALGVLALFITASLVIQITGEDDPDSAQPPSTTIELDLATPVPTAVPTETLDVGALGEFDMPETRYPPMVSAPTPLQQQIPGFPVVPGSADQDLSSYDLEVAVANNMPGAEPQRSMFNIVGSELTGSVTSSGTASPPIRATAATEPGSARDALTLEYGANTSRFVVDRAGQLVYLLRQEDNGKWRALEPGMLMAGSGTASLNELFDAFVTGPLTPAALEHATITPSEGLMRIMGGGYARRFDVDVPIEHLRPYGALLFANVTEAAVASQSVPQSITFQVYVTREARLALVTSNFTIGPQMFALSQFFDQRPANVRIELPEVPDESELALPTSP